MSPAPQKCSVLIVGAGPTGLFLASELRRQGVDCRLIDKNCGPCQQARATSIQPRSLEILEQVGLIDPFLANGNLIKGVKTFVDGNRLIDQRNLSELESPFPFEISLPQSRTESLLIDHLSNLGQSVERNVELVTLEQDASQVRAVLQRDGRAEEVVEVEYLIGCDGSHSTIRHRLGMHLEGCDYPATFAVADVRIDGPDSTHDVYLFCSPTEGIFLSPLPGGRFLFAYDLPEDQPLPAPGSSPTQDELQVFLDRAGPGNWRLYDPTWSAYFHCMSKALPEDRA